MLFCLLLVLTLVNAGKRIPPLYNCSGTHYDCFKKLGTHFKTQINFIFDNYDTFIEYLLPWYQEHPETFREYVALVQNGYPQYYDELQGMADGAGIPFDYVFLLNMENEIRSSPLPEEPFYDKGYIEHCTDIHVNFEDSHCIGHNEDGGLIWHNTSYFIDFTLVEEGYPDEHYLSFCYAGQLPGLALSFNKYGLTFTMNGLNPDVGRVGVIKNIVNRDVLSANSFDEVILKTIGVSDRAFGHSMNVADIYNLDRQVLIELSSHDSALREVVGNYSHMNNYRLLDIGYQADNSSTHRLARVNELPAPRNEKDIAMILGDTEDKEYPIYRVYTMISGIFNLDKKYVNIYNDNPKTSEPVLTWSLVIE